jgi:hypothetical protein
MKISKQLLALAAMLAMCGLFLTSCGGGKSDPTIISDGTVTPPPEVIVQGDYSPAPTLSGSANCTLPKVDNGFGECFMPATKPASWNTPEGAQ